MALNRRPREQGDKVAKKQRMKSETVKLVTPEFRASFPAVFEAKSAPNSTKKQYSIQMLFRVAPNPKDPQEPVVDIEPLKALVRNVVIEKFGPDKAKWPPVVPPGEDAKVGFLKLPFRDGGDMTHKDKPGYGVGVIFAQAAKNGEHVRPGVVHSHAGPDGRPAPLTMPTDLYGGCYCRAEVNAYFWEYMGKLGVSLGLNHVQKLRDGEPFGAQGAAEDAFEAITPPAGAAVGTAGVAGTGL